MGEALLGKSRGESGNALGLDLIDTYNTPTLTQDGTNTYLSLPNKLKSYKTNQRVLIKLPSNYSTTTTYININNLGNKLITGELLANGKYELVYNGESFDADIALDYWVGTQTEYNALGTYSPTTLYLIKEE